MKNVTVKWLVVPALTLSFTAKQAIAAKDWTIHFSQIAPIQSYESEDFTVKHLNGDLHLISLKDNFSGFSQGETKTLIFRANFWSLAESDIMPNYIVSAPELEARVIESTVPYIDKDTGLEVVPHVETFTDVATQFKRSSADKTQWLTSEALYQRNSTPFQGKAAVDEFAVVQAIIPTPKSVNADLSKGFADLSQGLAVSLGNVKHKAVDAALSRLDALGVKQSNSGLPLHLSIVSNDEKIIGSYKLNISEKEISVIGVDSNGVFNGLQSLASLFTMGESRVPMVVVEDEPHYAFHGLLVDVARNFHSKEFILKLLDQMAEYKLNKLLDQMAEYKLNKLHLHGSVVGYCCYLPKDL